MIFLLACAGQPDDSAPVIETSTELTDANNYSFDSQLNIPSLVTVSGADATVCWDQSLNDMQCHAMDPLTDVLNVGVVRLPNLTHEEVEATLAADDLQQADISGYVEFEPAGETCASLSAFSFFGTSIDLATEYVEGAGSFMLLLSSSTEPGAGAINLAFLEPQTASDVTEVDVPDGCGVVSYTADLVSATPLPLPVDPAVITWDGLTRDGQGAAFDEEAVDGILLARVEATPEELQTKLLDIELIAVEMYSLEVDGTSADLSLATGASGSFMGFTGEGTWLFALECSGCYNPAPLFLGVVEAQ